MRDDKLANSSTTTVTDKSLPLQDAQVNVATPNPLEGDELFMERVFGGPAAPVTEHLRARTTDARRETKAEKTVDCLRKRQLSLSIIKLCPSLSIWKISSV